MKFAIFILLVASSVYGQLNRGFLSSASRQKRQYVNTPPAATVSFTDDFNRADSSNLGANWTEINGDLQIIGNTLQNASVSVNDSAVYNTPVNTVNQYVKFKIIDDSSLRTCKAILRYTDASSPFYVVECDAQFDTVEWFRVATATFGTVASVQSVSQAITSGDTVGVVVSGTGTSTVVAFWLNPTGAAPTSATLWGGAAPTQSFTNDPANAVDTGSKVGVCINSGSAPGQKLDDFSGGDVP